MIGVLPMAQSSASNSSQHEPLQPGRPVLIYGAGGYGHWVFTKCRQLGIPVAAVIDRETTARDWCAPISMVDAARQFPQTPVVLGVFSPQPDVHSVSRQLRSVGLSTVISPPAFFGDLGSHGLSESLYCLKRPWDLLSA